MAVAMHLELAECECEAGDLTLVVRDRRLCGLVFSDHWHWLDHWLARRFGEVKISRTKDPAHVITHMRAYLRGELDALDAIEVDTGGTEFQQQVWTMLRKMAKPGKTITYGELARAVGAPNASRAVGAANGQNPISIVIPCHRVIGSTGALTGYGGGMPRKEWLLAHEGARPAVMHASLPF
jgi:methylated-DNA-[protein]-cysteine S-methyltransferase